MNWSNIRLIVSREILDQLRDRRTIFVIAILPLLLYPLLGMSFLQVAQFLKQHPTRIWVIGAERLPSEPALLNGANFQVDLLTSPDEQRLFELKVEQATQRDPREAANLAVRSGKYDAVVLISESFANHVRLLAENQGKSTTETGGELSPEVIYNQTKDKSRVARERVVSILTRWRSRIVEQTLTDKEVPVEAAKPFQVRSRDVSAEKVRRAAVWSKILPFVLIIWAMTGAFYPAVDLCAGEKERGTLETLLSCPASRQEIVWGKLLTVMVFSMATSLLNLTSMGLTGRFVVGQLQALSGAAGGLEIGPPPFAILGWVMLALVPISALFSALSLALAAMARSSKEGQYYLMPLLFGTMPLMMLPMFPAVELDLGNSLIPVTGVILLLRNLIEGQHLLALKYAVPVMGVTGICCWLSILWATHQFEDENVLFHESERFDLKSWLVHLFRDRGPVPTVAQAFLCGAMLMMARFFAGLMLPVPIDFRGFVSQTVILQVALIAGPPIVMAWLLTRNPEKTLLLRLPRLSHLLAAVLLAVTLHPVASGLAMVIQNLYPISEQTLQQLKPLQAMLGEATSLWQILALLALLPAICEELAFRGFILSGLGRMQDRVLAIVVSSLFFAIAHPVLQQSLTAFALGLVIAYIALKTGSILPCMLFHCVHNGLQLSAGTWAMAPSGWMIGLVEVRDPGIVVYAWPIVAVAAVASLGLLVWFENRSRVAKNESQFGTELSPVA